MLYLNFPCLIYLYEVLKETVYFSDTLNNSFAKCEFKFSPEY